MMVFFLFGVFFSTFFTIDPIRILYFAFAIAILQIGIYFIFRQQFTNKILILTSLVFFIGIYAFANKSFSLDKATYSNAENQKISAIITSYPENKTNSQEFIVTIENIDQKIKLLVKSARYPERQYGDKIEILGKIEKPENFDNFDYINYLRKSEVVGIIKNPSIEFAGTNQANKIVFWLFKIRNNIESQIKSNLPEPESSLASGILLGSREGFSKSLTDQFNRSGITHIIALSGFNVTIIIVAISTLLLGVVSKKINFLISLALVIFFVIMTGGSASVIRAAIISLLIVFGTTIGRQADKTNLILLAATFMTLVNPYVLRYDIGFQLSFLAYIGLVCFSEPILRLFQKKKISFMPKVLQVAFSETLSAQIIVLPLLLTTFGQISIIAPISNLLILPLIPLTMLLAFLSSIFSLLIPTVGKIVFLMSYLPLKYILYVSEKMANLPFAAIILKSGWQMVSIIIYSLALSLVVYLFRKRIWLAEKIT